MNTRDRIIKLIATRRSPVILRSELNGLASYSQVTRSLGQLVNDGTVVRVGKGIYAKTRISSLSGKRVVAGTLETITLEALKKMGVEVSPGKLTHEYNSGKSTQLPVQFVLNTGNRRISRKISVGGRTLMYDNNFKTS